jgi:hypothetical protein
MSGFRKNKQRLAQFPFFILAILTAVVAASGSACAQARPVHRETNANRKQRIERTIQDTYSHRWEIFGGGGYLRFRSGEYLQRNNQVTWATSATYFLNPKLGITGDIRGSYGDAKVGNTIYNIGNPLITQYTFMGGPSYRLYTSMKFAVSINGMGGYALGNFDGGSKGIPAEKLGMWSTSNKPVISGNINVDYNLYPNIAIRVTPTYVGTFFRGNDVNVNGSLGATNGTIQNNLGVNAGVVYRFGRITKK